MHSEKRKDNPFGLQMCLACNMPMADDDVRMDECPWCRSNISSCEELREAGIDVDYVHSFLSGRARYLNINKLTCSAIKACYQKEGYGH